MITMQGLAAAAFSGSPSGIAPGLHVTPLAFGGRRRAP